MRKAVTRQPVTDPCERCKVHNAKKLVDIHATVVILGKRLCDGCTNKVLLKYPHSSAVNLQRYETE